MTFKTFIIILFLPLLSLAQKSITLEQCWKGAREQMPVMQNKGVLQQLDSIEQLVLKSNYLPQINANAQLIWQSDVTSVDIPLPGITIDEPSNEQYKAYVEIKQLIWDGGRTSAIQEQSKTQTELSVAQTDEAFYSIKKRVASLYYACILSQKQMELTQELIKTISEKMVEVDAGVKQGVVREAGKYVLEVEKLKAEQDLSNQQYQTQGILQMLNILTGLNIETTDHLELPKASVPKELERNQLTIYDLQVQAAEKGKLVLQKNRMPVVAAFAQAGYGKPGLNMLNNDPDGWLMAGATVSWNIFDWKTTKRRQQKLALQQQMIDNSREQFIQQVETEQQQYLSDIEKYTSSLEKDLQILELRSKITEDFSTQLKQGTVTSSAYIDELFKEQAAKIQKEIHAIQLNQTQINLQILFEK